MYQTAEEVRVARFHYISERIKDIQEQFQVLHLDDCLYGINWPDISMEAEEATFKPKKTDKILVCFVADCEDLEIFSFTFTIGHDKVSYSYEYTNLDCFTESKSDNLEASLSEVLTIPTVMEKLADDLKILLQKDTTKQIIEICVEAYQNIH